MGLRFPAQVHGECFFVTTTFRDHIRYGDTPGMYDALCDSLRFCLDREKAQLIAYCFMPSHIHLVLVLPGERLAAFMRDFKKFIAQKGTRRLGIGDSAVWMPRYDRVAIYSAEILRKKVEYIHQNPVKAGLVARQEMWKWSSFSAYVGGNDGPLPVCTGWFE